MALAAGLNFKIFSNTRFSVGVDILLRRYQAVEKRNGLIKIRDISSGAILYDNLSLTSILIDGQRITNIAELQKVIFNVECFCDPEESDGDFKIFDLTFDHTFE